MSSLNPQIADYSPQVIEGAAYRHFKGGYYVVLHCACNEENFAQLVVYQSLETGKVWSRPLLDFVSPVPEDKPNPTGQEHRFERVERFTQPLTLSTTEALVEELESRPDSPLFDAAPKNILSETYLVGNVVEVFVGVEEGSYTDFDTYITCTTLEEAREESAKRGMSIAKRIITKVDF